MESSAPETANAKPRELRSSDGTATLSRPHPALGALLPATEFENRTLGSSKDKLKDEAEEFALRQLDKADKVAEHAFKEARDAAEREGLTGEAVVGDAVESLERSDVVPPANDRAREPDRSAPS